MRQVFRNSVLAVIVLLLACFSAARADITVSSEEELVGLCGVDVKENVNIVGKTYDMSSYNWTPIRTLKAGCTINGNGAVIVGLDLNAVIDNDRSGFIGENRGTIENLTVVVTSDFTVTKYLGCVAARNALGATIDNCVVYAETEGAYTISAGTSMDAGGVVGENKGAITNCMVRNLAFVSSGRAEVGGIAGNNGSFLSRGSISDCYVYNISIANTNGGPSGRYGFIVGNAFHGSVRVASAENCTLSSDKSYIGGVTGFVDYDAQIENCWIKNCDIILTGNGKMGGLFGTVIRVVPDDPGVSATQVTSCYVAGLKDYGIRNTASGAAGGVVGVLDSDDGTEGVLFNCFFETDNALGISDTVGSFTNNATADNLANCAGVSTTEIQGPDFAYDNLGTGWIRNTDRYPVYSDGSVKLAFIVRPSKDGVPLNRNNFRVKVGDLNDLSYVNADTVIPLSEFSLQDLIQDGTDLAVDCFTVNGIQITGDVYTNDYLSIDFSARVTNNTAAALQTLVDNYKAIYQRGRRMYTASSLATLKSAMDAAEAALGDHYINITKTESDSLTAAIEGAALDKVICNVTFDAEHGAVQYCGAAVSELKAEINTAAALTAAPDSGYEFVCWKDTGGNIIGLEASLSYTVFRTTTVTAEFRPAGRYTFTYRDSYGKTYKIQQVTDYSELSYPVAAGETGLRTGFAVKSWTNDYGGDLPASGAVTGDVVFTAELVRIAADVFTVKYRPNPDAQWIEGEYRAAGLFEAAAEDSYGGAAFSCWKDGDGNVVSYDKTLSVSVYADCEFTAYYDGAAASVTVAALQSAAANSDTGKIAFTGQVIFGDDFSSEVYHGVLMLKSSSAVADLDFNTPGVIVGKSSGYSALTNTFIINKKNVAAGETWYGRAFIVYYDADDELQIAFSDVKSATM
ncbi:MAG: hypothetical protein J5758_03435 [Abditibacteriota bacterium]|nr:hypothetical protein [Abditibacteriota bacterium]